MESRIFVDGIKQVHFINGVVRMDLFTLQGEQGSEPKQEDAGQVIMTPQAFLGSLDAMQKLASKLAGAGIFQKKES